MKRLELDQNSPEWEEFRRSHIGASDVPIILGKSPFKKPLQLWEEKVLGKKGYSSKAMQDGHDLEPMARDWANMMHEANYQAATYIHENNWLMASLDGYDESLENIIEIKHPNEKTIKSIHEGSVPDYYLYQIQTQMYVMNKKRACLVFPQENYKYLLSKGEKINYVMMWIDRSESMIVEILEAGFLFYKSMLEFTSPEPQKSDYVERSDSDWSEAAIAWLKAKEALNLAEEYEAICKDSLKYLAGDASVRGGGVTVCKGFAKGSVDYARIPELKSVNLDTYRKPPSERWRIVAV